MNKDASAHAEKSAARKNTALIAVRDALGMKQADFAQLVCCSQSQITSVELGRRAATPEFAWQVAVRTGVDPDCLLQPGAEARDQQGRTYSRLSFEDHQEPAPDRLIEPDVEVLLTPIKLTLQAAAEAGRLRDFASKLKESVERQISLLPGVREAVQRQVERASGARGRVTVGDLKRDPALADKLWSDSAAEELEGRADDEVVFERKIDPERFMWRSPWYSVAKKVREDANQSMANR